MDLHHSIMGQQFQLDTPVFKLRLHQQFLLDHLVIMLRHVTSYTGGSAYVPNALLSGYSGYHVQSSQGGSNGLERNNSGVPTS